MSKIFKKDEDGIRKHNRLYNTDKIIVTFELMAPPGCHNFVQNAIIEHLTKYLPDDCHVHELNKDTCK